MTETETTVLPTVGAESLPAERAGPPNPIVLMQQVIAAGITEQSVTVLERLAAMQERFQAQSAEREFGAALAEFQARVPAIAKSSPIEFTTKKGGKFRSEYAKLQAIIKITAPLRAELGFAHSFEQVADGASIGTICVLRHRAGHTTRTPFLVPRPTTGYISEQHDMAGAATFTQRYAFQAALGIVTEDMPDNDGKAFAAGTITREQVATLADLLDAAGADEQKFMSTYGVATLEELPAPNFAAVVKILKQRLAKKREAGE